MVFHVVERAVEIPPGVERVLRVASSVAPKLLGDRNYILIETPEKMDPHTFSLLRPTLRNC